MQFVRLGLAYTNTYIPDLLIEGYNSLVWTERFATMGEFELKSFDVDGLTAALPEDTAVSHLETQVVMLVETHSIELVGEGKDAVPEITIKGRTADLILESRFVNSTYQQKRRMRQKYSPRSALDVLLWNAVDNTSGFDVTRGDTDPDTEDVYNNYSWNKLDAIPNVAVTDSVSLSQSLRWWQLEQGILYPQLASIMTDADLGLRVLRPVKVNTADVVKVDSVQATRGNITRTSTSGITQLRFDIYNGVDHSGDVQLSLLQGHLEKPQYLRSIQPWKSVVDVMTSVPGDWTEQYRNTAPTEAAYTGFRRKVLAFDAGQPELPAEPSKPGDLKSSATDAQKRDHRKAMDDYIDKYGKWKNKRDGIWSDFRTEQQTSVQKALKAARLTMMFQGDLSILSPYKYKVHYDLGDTVSLFGDYGYASTMIVAEYVRTEDAQGDRGFPGLVAP